MVDFSYVEPSDPWWSRQLVRLVETCSGRRKLFELYQDYDRNLDFFDEAVRLLAIDLRYDAQKLEAAPVDGPLVIVANHPFGIVDGLALTHLIGQKRRDLRVIAHGLLTRAPEAAERILPIDFSETREALQTNLTTRRMATQWLADGGAILIFPSGMISTATGFGKPVAEDRWKPFAGRLIHEARCPVLPMFTEGRNSWLFQLASLIHPTARAATHLNEVRNKIGKPLQVHIGDTIAYSDLAHLRDRQVLVDALYAHSHGLARSGLAANDDGEDRTKTQLQIAT